MNTCPPQIFNKGRTIVPPLKCLFSQIEAGNDIPVFFNVLRFDVIEQTTALADHLQKAAAAVIVVRMLFQMFVEVVDPLGKESDLHFGRTGVPFMSLVLVDDLSLLFLFHCFTPWKLNSRRQSSARRTARL